VLNITNRFLLGAVAASTLLCASAARANPCAVAAWTALAISGQNAKPATDPRRECAALLAQSRKAMTEQDWNAADALISQAESLKVQFNRLHLGDTPVKARRDLEKSRPAAAKKPAGKPAPQDPFATHDAAVAPRRTTAQQEPIADAAEPSEVPRRMSQALSDRDASMQEIAPAGQYAPARPLAAAPARPRSAESYGAGQADMNQRVQPAVAHRPIDAAPAMPAAAASEMAVESQQPGEPRRLVAAADAQAGAVDQVTNFSATPPEAGPSPERQQSDQLLVASRKSLAVGDLAQATRLVEQAKAMSVRYGIHDDSPTKVSACIAKQMELGRQKESKDTDGFRRRAAELLMEQADALLAWKEFGDAERLATDAKRIPVSYGPFDAKPDDLLNRILAARKKAGRFRDNSVQPAGAEMPLADNESTGPEDLALEGPPRMPNATPQVGPAQPMPATGGRYENAPQTAAAPLESGPLPQAPANMMRQNPTKDVFNLPVDPAAGNQQANTRAQQTGGQVPTGTPYESTGVDAASPTAPDSAAGFANQRPQVERIPAPLDGQSGTMLGKATAEQTVLARKAAAEFMERQSEAKRIQQADPDQALVILQQARASLEKSKLEPTQRDQLLRAADRKIVEMQNYIETNRPRIELDKRNRAVKGEIAREQDVKVEVQEKLAFLVDDFNKLMDEMRFAEAEVVAKKAEELSPHEPVVQQLRQQARFARRWQNAQQVASDKEQGFIDQLATVDQASIGFNDNEPIQYPSNWNDYSKSDFRKKKEGKVRRTDKELEIERGLKTPVLLKFQGSPLSEVIDHLEKLTMVNMHLDPRGLASEGLTDDTPITINLSAPITLKSALNLILEPLHMSYVIKNEVLNITSEQMRDGEIITVTYSVADLIVPIPNFMPNGQMGLAGALTEAQNSARSGMIGGFANSAPMAAVASNTGSQTSATIDPRIMAQMPGVSGASGPISGVDTGGRGGPGGLGGGSAPDFDSLTQLLTSTVSPDSWEENGGPGAIQKYANNLSLVISNTLQVHEQIADLLDQLRRLHDLQVTIEVRFITLNDNFFERIGVDFDFRLEDFAPASIVGAANVGTLNQANVFTTADPQLKAPNDITVGLSAPGVFTADLDVPFTQDSFTSAIPQFGFVPNVGGQLGFAILSDIEAFFFIEAAQGDRRSNVLQAPKVTLFNGQQAFVSDTSQSPFVVSVVPVVGDFAAAQQPVIVVLSEGTFLTVQAVVSEDRRYVRMTLVPFFSSIGQVNTFTFTGSSSSTTASNSSGATDNTTGRANAQINSREGTTVQLPTFSFVSVSTTVSVPDGGTVLLGGIKRLSEGRNEFGVPILNKLPYVNRLFKNVGIGRTTQSLMMMVTPRIIIQEEEEFNLTGQNPPGT